MKAEKIQKEHLYTFLQTLQHQRAVDLLPELTRGLLGETVDRNARNCLLELSARELPLGMSL